MNGTNSAASHQQALEEFSAVLKTDLKLLETNIYEKAGVKFNIASPKQLGEVLFDKLILTFHFLYQHLYIWDAKNMQGDKDQSQTDATFY